MLKRQKNRLIFKTQKKYGAKISVLKKWIKQYNPVVFVDKFCKLRGLKRVEIIHKPLKLSAEFKIPNKILVDFRNPEKYILLSLAHEYAHLLLRAYISIPYQIEQSLAILLQLSYEDSAKIRKFSRKTAKELMQLMNVWPVGKILFKNWSAYWNPKTGKTNQYRNILIWLRKHRPYLDETEIHLR